MDFPSPTWRAEIAVELATTLSEGPLWDAPAGRLLWVDIEAGAVHAFVPGGASGRVAELSSAVGFLVRRSAGGYLAGTAEGIVALGPDLGRVGLVAAPPDLAGRRINDGTCDPAGRVIFGTVDPSRRRKGTLWSLAPGSEPRPLAEEVGMSNGIGFSPDGRWMYFVDTPTRRVDRFRYDARTGSATERRPFFALPPGPGIPDGLAVDREGAVWVALWGAGEVWRIGADGVASGRLVCPIVNTSSCAFGPPGSGKLFVTTAAGPVRAVGADSDRPLLAGSLLVTEVGTDGVEVASAYM